MSSSPSDLLAEFEAAFSDRTPPAFPKLPSDRAFRNLRMDLLTEEYDEYLKAEQVNDLVEVADALADMVYIIFGTAHHYGIPLDAVLAEVHRSNMAKVGPGGVVSRRPDGKVLKPGGWTPPDVAGVLIR